MKKNYRLLWLFACLLSIGFSLLAFDAFVFRKYFTGTAMLCGALIALLWCWNLISVKMKETEKILSAIRQKDFSLFPKEHQGEDVRNNAVKLYYQAREEHTQLYSYKNLYDSILDKLETGFLILQKKKEEQNRAVFYCNPAFLNILNVPRYSQWEYYREKIPQFYRLIEETGFGDSQEFMDISIGDRARQSYSVRTSGITAYGTHFCIISLESIQKIIDQKEKQAWNNLMKVISHELLNTLTPVNSLIHNLEYLTAQDSLNREDQTEIRQSLKIINSKSQQLLHFIDSYRQIAELPKPRKTTFSLKTCTENVLKIFSTEFEKEGINLSLRLADFHITADEKMMERVLVNLITNALHALKNRSEKQIQIEIYEQNNRTIIRVQDNGEGVEPQIADKIFLPFFTTRSHGSGIGLTLAKSIMEAHNGYLTYRKVPDGSAFEMWMIKNY